jgi:tetratricopeptide (TPR) repeat protein
MNKRLAMLEQLTTSGGADAFAWYALALEYRKEQRIDDAMRTFQALREREADYLPMYLMAGQVLTEVGRHDEARVWLEEGVVLARSKGDTKTLGELEDALADL